MENTVTTAPVGQLKTNKGLLKTILLSLITFGIYPLVASICKINKKMAQNQLAGQ